MRHGHAANAAIANPPFVVGGAHGGRKRTLVSRSHKPARAPGVEVKPRLATDTMLELMAFVREREWGLELDHGGSGAGHAKFVVATAGAGATTSGRSKRVAGGGYGGKQVFLLVGMSP